MTVERVEWQCPGCERRFAIPAGVPTPELCPQCQAAAPSRPDPPSPKPAPPKPPPQQRSAPPQPPLQPPQPAPQPPQPPPQQSQPAAPPQFPSSQIGQAAAVQPAAPGIQTESDDGPTFQQQPAPPTSSSRAARRKYTGLRTLAFCYKMLAFVLSVGAMVGIFVALASLNQDVSAARTTRITIGLSVFGGGMILSLGMLGIAKLIEVLLDVEENTRHL